ncbi:MAG TPA: endonuclease MutS2 [Dehalococcoidia bacterium]|nr:endonuclease MutS2 [Dehalococcoidia bacterium]
MEKRPFLKQKSQQVLEFEKIRDRLARYASFEASRELARGLQPAYSRQEIERRQCATAEARDLLRRRPDLGAGDAHDVRQASHQAGLEGVLEAETLLRIRSTLAVARTVRAALTKMPDLPHLAEVAGQIEPLPHLEEAIGRSIDPRGQVLDSASPLLRRIRSELKVAQARVVDRLNALIASAVGRTALQEPIVTLRDGRYVVPVKADERGQVPGVVHGTSSSGATLFVEPLVTVDLNNQWRELQLSEQREVQRVLRDLSSQVGIESERICVDVDALAEIDLALAKARYAEALGAVRPEITEAEMNLPAARHPLLAGDVVPIDLRLGGEFRSLVITGPNTGGKTVALKTAGLLTLMALAGLAIPAGEGARVPLVSGVYADIGDEQSIEQSLSTFSSHLKNIVRILRQADGRSLILLDEIGAGTDPSEGSALARAILNRLNEMGALVIATTHYTELKAYAETTEGVANASVEFDPQTLRPTYRLQIGLPGRSNALAIAARLGLDREIIADARSMLSPAQLQSEELLARIQAERRQAEAERRRAASERVEAERLRRELEHKVAELERQRRAILEDAERQAAEEVRRARLEVGEVIRQARSARTDRSGLEAARRRLAEVTGRPISAAAGALGLPAAARADGLPRPGDTVRVRSWNQNAELLSLPDGAAEEAEVAIGSFRVRVPLTDLEWHGGPIVRVASGADRGGAGRTVVLPPPPPVQLEVDLRGRRVAEVVEDVDRALDEALQAGQPYLRIIHGKGTGALRQVIRQQLAGHQLVESFRSGEPAEGGDGATIVYLSTGSGGQAR